MPIQVKPDGPIPAKIMIVGEAPGADEEAKGIPFVGASGIELNKMLQEVGITRSECFITNVARERPLGNNIENFIAFKKKDITKEHKLLRDKYVKKPILDGMEILKTEIKAVKPNIIIALGNTPLWALTGLWGIVKQRGSMLYEDISGLKCKVIPTYHPAAILRQWEWRSIAVSDLRRAARFRGGLDYPVTNWNFRIRPSIDTVIVELTALIVKCNQGITLISFDLETRNGHIACAGISWTPTDALCIPLMCMENQSGYWSEDEEANIIHHLYRLLTHPNCHVVGQNLLYDSQYTYRHWHFIPNVKQDSMISHHVAFAGLPKRLDFQASMYCNQYVYWKDDSKHWEKGVGENQLWSYNCEDCVRTAECAEVEKGIIDKFNLQEPEEFQQAMFYPVLAAMLQGVRIDLKARNDMAMELSEEMFKRESFFEQVLGHNLNPRSPKQMQQLFYDDLKQPIILKKGRPTLDDDALTRLGQREPLLRPLLKNIAEYRTLGVFLSTFVLAELDYDNRMRCSYNICGTETYRLSSSENAFDCGTNLQNIPKGSVAKDPEDLTLPNIRKIFIPDPGMVFFDMDLDRADLQVVVWEADDKDLKLALRLGLDMHLMNACSIFNIKGIPYEELTETHSNYKEHRERIGEDKRQKAKQGVHATNYGCKGRTLSQHLNSSVHEADKFISSWLAAHPGVGKWHTRTEQQLRTRRYVENKFGYRRFYFDRIEGLLPEALAWIPQSTVALTINRIWLNIYCNLGKDVKVLLQVHDSLAGQYPKQQEQLLLPLIKKNAQIVIPYEDPLIIPIGIKTSEKSWGDVK
jgi:uracil-DNA glycosylase family 4